MERILIYPIEGKGVQYKSLQQYIDSCIEKDPAGTLASFISERDVEVVRVEDQLEECGEVVATVRVKLFEVSFWFTPSTLTEILAIHKKDAKAISNWLRGALDIFTYDDYIELGDIQQLK